MSTKDLIWVVVGVLGAMALILGITFVDKTLADNRTPEQRFVDTVQSQVTGLEHEAGREIISTGMALCGAKERGATPEQIRQTFTDTGFTAREADVFAEAAETHLCDNNG